MGDDSQLTREKTRRGLLVALTLAATVVGAVPGKVRLHAQLIRARDGVPSPAFDVASVKPNNSGSGGSHVRSEDARYSVQNLSLRRIIEIAYGVQSDAQITGGSGAILGSHYDIEAKMDDAQYAQIKGLLPADHRRQICLMVQSLLAERFYLRVHFEMKNLPVYALTPDKGGPKLSASVSAPSDHPGISSHSSAEKAEASGREDRALDGLTGLLAN
jgi:uncharacterized protein (TIGR03435 family)